MSKKRVFLTPWIDWVEWMEVRDALLADGGKTDDSVYMKRWALNRTIAWKLRQEHLPLAIESTAQIVEIFLHDSMYGYTAGSMYRSEMELQLMYSAVIIRTVNGLVDTSQKGAYASSVGSLAQQIGIPLWIVDVRHESSHNKLPSLKILRLAAQHLIEWLKTNYWDSQTKKLLDEAEEIYDELIELFAHESTDSKIVTASLTCPRTLNDLVIPMLVHGRVYGKMYGTGILTMEVCQLRKEKNNLSQSQKYLCEFQLLWPQFLPSLVRCFVKELFSHLKHVHNQSADEKGSSLTIWIQRLSFTDDAQTALGSLIHQFNHEEIDRLNKLGINFKGKSNVTLQDVTSTWEKRTEWVPSPLGTIDSMDTSSCSLDFDLSSLENQLEKEYIFTYATDKEATSIGVLDRIFEDAILSKLASVGRFIPAPPSVTDESLGTQVAEVIPRFFAPHPPTDSLQSSTPQMAPVTQDSITLW